MDKFKNKYRIPSHRKPNWDYSADALYFLTIITQNREFNLGQIVDNEMTLSDFGKIVQTEWYKSFEIRNELILHEFVIMPNHLHAIVEIDNGTRVETHGRASLPIITDSPIIADLPIVAGLPTVPDLPIIAGLPTIPRSPIVPDLLSIKQNPPIRLPKSISSFMAGFKSAVNTKIDDYIDDHQLQMPKYNRNNHFFQPNYHDHIIRNDIEYQNIQNYITNNPMNWEKDKFHRTNG